MLTIRLDFDLPFEGYMENKHNYVTNLHSITNITFISFTIILPITFDYLNVKEVDDFTNDVDEEFNDLEEDSIQSISSSIEEEEEPELLKKARMCIEKDEIELCLAGVGGTYFIKENGKKIGIFKPRDEEPGGVNNPKKGSEEPLLPPGGGAKREVAAYLLDRGFSGVPETHFFNDVKSKIFNNSKDGNEINSKSGSFQKFVENIGDTTSLGSNLFSTEDVHKIGILDIRIMNMDRNDENMLVSKDGDRYKLIPIDHTYAFPPTLDSVWFDWMYWRQAKAPFDKDTLDYINNIDIDKDADILRSVGIEEDSIRVMRISTIALKRAANVGMNLFQIASIISRKKPKEKSDLEKIVENAEKFDQNFEEKYIELLDKFLLSK